MTKPTLLLYLHGFNSSPQSHKAQVMQEYCRQHRPDIHVLVPKLPAFPIEASQYLLLLMQKYQQDYTIGLVGSSLGGYLSTWLSAQFNLRAVLVNPAIKPYELLSDYLGEQVNPYTNEHYVLEAKHIDELRLLDVKKIENPENFWLLQQKGDEILDYRQAVEKYSNAQQTVEEGGDHSFVDFERYPEQIISFLDL